ncbi:hypothetical protein, partial [Streptomyces sp. NPDC005953]|uniref:hypothetical protein n=1 Tax=Streptomyces sp. NPDC005953 TaxID=3156719 RepID=UPI0033E1CFD2
MAFEGSFADVIALYAGHPRQHNEHDDGGIVRALQLPARKLQADIARLQFLREHSDFDATAKALVFVDDECDAHSRGTDLTGELRGGRPARAVSRP